MKKQVIIQSRENSDYCYDADEQKWYDFAKANIIPFHTDRKNAESIVANLPQSEKNLAEIVEFDEALYA